MTSPTLIGNLLVWRAKDGAEFHLDLAREGASTLRTPGGDLPDVCPCLDALWALPRDDGLFLPWALAAGREESARIQTALLALLDKCAACCGAERASEAAGPLFRLRLLAGLARSTRSTQKLDRYLQEVSVLAKKDVIFESDHDVEADLLEVIRPEEPLEFLELDLHLIVRIEDWLARRFAWRKLLQFRRARAMAARQWLAWYRKAKKELHEAEWEGDEWKVQEIKDEIEDAKHQIRTHSKSEEGARR